MKHSKSRKIFVALQRHPSNWRFFHAVVGILSPSQKHAEAKLKEMGFLAPAFIVVRMRLRDVTDNFEEPNKGSDFPIYEALGELA